MSEFRALPIKSLAFVPVLLGSAQSAIAIPNESALTGREPHLLIAQAVDSVAEADTQFSSEIRSGSVHTLVTTEGSTTQIDGGVRAGSNLFHRFDGFGIGVGETANFVTPETTQAVFGQVAGGGASYVNGQLQVSGSDASLYLINPAGVLFGPDAQLNLGGSLTVTTADQIGFGEDWLDLAEAGDSRLDYANLTGTPDAYRFTTERPGAVVNQADLAVGERQSIRLVGGDIVNTGRLSAAGGEVTLTAVGERAVGERAVGEQVDHAPAESVDGSVEEPVDEQKQRLVRLGSQGALLSVEVADAAVKNGVWNPLSVPELLTGASVGADADNLRVNQDGSVDLLAAGAVLASAGADAFGGRVLSAGDIDVSGTAGGEINLLGAEVDVIDGRLAASGELDGGLIQVGGGYQGKGALPRASRVLFGERAIARADGLVNGDGGQVILWSDGETRFDGSLSAEGAGSGVGGLVETSGLTRLSVGEQASVSTYAAQGLGEWLLDPDSLRVVGTAGAGAEIVAGTNSPDTASEVMASTVVTALNGTNVRLQAGNAITVDAAIDASGNSTAGNLTLDAPTLNLNERITLRSDSFVLPGEATSVNVGAGGGVQNAIDAVATGGTVNLAAATYSETSDILVQRDVTLKGQGQDATTLSGSNAHRVLTLQGSGSPGFGDDINVIVDSLAIRSGVSDYGAGIAALDGVNLSLTNSLVENNVASTGTQIGGGLFLGQTGSSIIRNTTISQNLAGANGGGLAIAVRHQLLVENSTLSNNRADSFGGAIDSSSSDVVIRLVGGRVEKNTSALAGGGISLADGVPPANITSFFVDGTTFEDNTSTTLGGAIALYSTTADIRNATFTNNRAAGGAGGAGGVGGAGGAGGAGGIGGAGGVGGAIATNGNLTVADSLFENNSAPEGGAIALQADGTSSINQTTFHQNNATISGGAVHLNDDHKLTLSSSTLYENTSQSDGGAIQMVGGSPSALTLINSTISGNSANGNGGGLFLNTAGTTVIESTTIANNEANLGGGLYRTSGSSPTIRRSIIAGNRAASGWQDIRGDIISGGNNLVQDRNDTAGYVASDLPGNTNPLLGALADNGGGLLTMALLPGSPAIDAGGPAVPGEVDQRGAAIVGLRDIGAYEFQTVRTVGDLFFVAGENQFATVDTNYANLFQVKVTDTLGAALSGIQVDFMLPTSGASGIIDAGASTLITDINGIASLVARASQAAGQYTLLAQTADGIASTSTTVTNRADVASQFSLSGPTTALVAGKPVDFSVTALDRFNNVADGYNSTVSFSSSDGRALLPGSSVLTNGIGSFNATPFTAGTQTFRVVDTADPTFVTDIGNIGVKAAAAEVLEIVAGVGQTAKVGSAFVEGLTVRVSDRFGNPVAGEPVAFSVPAAGAGAVLDKAVVLTNSAGLATVTVGANDVAGRYDAIASVAGLSGLFGLENEAAVVLPIDLPPIDLPPIDLPPVDPVPADLPPADSPPVESAGADSPPGSSPAETAAASPTAMSPFSNVVIPTEGTTHAGSSSDLLSEDKPHNQQLLSGRSDVFDEVAFAETEQLLTDKYTKYWRSPVGKGSTLDDVQKVLQQAATHHKSKSAVVYALFVPSGKADSPAQYPSVLSQRLLRNDADQDLDQLMLIMVPPEGQPVQQLIDVSRRQIVRQAQLLGIEISSVEENGYQPLARQLYNWLLAPIASDLQQNGIDNLMYVLDEGLRTVPLAAMMTGDRFAIEQYGISMLPSMGLLNAEFDTAPAEQTVLAAGADRFETLDALPAVPVELGLVGAASTSAKMLLNEEFSLNGLVNAQQSNPSAMMHLATHAAFNPGALDRSYVQLWDEQLTLDNISELNLSGLEMLILSACATAMGSREAELGFAGLASATGVEASIGSLWSVSDVGTMALMAEFYEHLRQNPLRFVALQQAQLSLLRGETWLENNKLITQQEKNDLPDGFAGDESMTFSHPFFWSGFTLIGSPWW